MPKKKILFTANTLNIGGIETALINLLDKLDYNRYDITLILEKKEGELLNRINSNVKVIDYNLSYSKNILIRKTKNLFKRINFILKNKNKYDFSCCYATYSKMGEVLTKIASKNTAIYIHGNYANMYNEKEFKEFFNTRNIEEFKHIIFVSNESKDNFLKIYPNLKDKSLVINNFINEKEIIENSKEKTEVEKTKDILFTFIGRLDEKSKRISKQLELIKNLKDKYNIELWIIGDGEDKEKYQNYIKENNLEENIKMLGSKLNPYPYMKEADYILMTSDYEGFPVVYMEAVVLNKKIITTQDLTDNYIDIKNNLGYIISKDINEMTKEIENILQSDKLEYKKIDIEKMNEEKLKELESIMG